MMQPRYLAATLLLICSGQCFGLTPRPSALDTYLIELAKVEQATAPVSLEPLFAAAEQAQDALMFTEDGDRAWIERLTADEFAALKSELRGIKLSRGYDIYAQPDGVFFYTLARAHGRAEDQAFFGLYRRFWNQQDIPRYLGMGKGTTLCVRFGEGILPTLYTRWQAYAKTYPEAYAAFAQQTLKDLEEAVGLGVCACGDARSVTRELKGFLQRFPQTPVADQIRDRLQELKDDPDRRPIHCR